MKDTIDGLMEEHEKEVVKGSITATFTQDNEAVRVKIDADASGKMVDTLIVELIKKRAELRNQRIEECLAEITVHTVLEVQHRRRK